MDTEFLTAKQAAELLQLDQRTLLRLVSEGTIPASRLGDGPRAQWRFSKRLLVDAIEEDMRVQVEV